jgi:ATP adenylyltransferase
MDHLWSPWRYQYVSGEESPREHKPACIFCAKSKPETQQRDYVLFYGEHCFGLLNIYPYTNGHLMIAPYEHVASLAEASEAACLEIMRYARRAEANLEAIYRCDGLNLGFNIGSAAGAGVAGHIHLHVLPRWQGDANFMSVIGETRVHPEGLDVTYSKLLAANWHLD